MKEQLRKLPSHSGMVLPEQEYASLTRKEFLSTKERRKALLSVIQNGGKSLAVLLLPEPNGEFLSPYQLGKAINAYLPGTAQNGSLNDQLSLLGELGVVEKAEEGNKWRATELGVFLKPAIIFAQKRFIALGIDGSDVLGKRMESPKGGKKRPSPPEVRDSILQDLRKNKKLQVIELVRSNNITINAVRTNHLSRLELANLCHVESANMANGDVTGYMLTPHAPDGEIPLPTYSNGYSIRQKTHDVVNALTFLTRTAPFATSSEIKDFLNTMNGTKLTTPDINYVVSFLVDKGLIAKTKFHKDYFSEVVLTSLGQQVVDIILKPLSAWCEDPSSVPQIAEIAQQISRDPHAFAFLYPHIAQSYCDASIAKNANHEAKLQTMFELIQIHSGEISQTDIARRLGCNPTHVINTLKPFIQRGVIEKVPAKRGHRYVLQFNGKNNQAEE